MDAFVRGEILTKSRYEILDQIAAGGMATVYVGRLRGALGFQRLVAIKRAHSFIADDRSLAVLLEREARLASLVKHPNVVGILDVEELEGELCLVLEYVEGCSLRDIQKSVPEGERDAAFRRAVIRIALDAGEGLVAAHRATGEDGAPLGLVHRDISPHNLLVGKDGVTRIADFGIARAEVTAGERTSTGVLKGKLAYSPPEYLEAQRFDERGDLFSFGVVVWELLAGRALFAGPTDAATLRNVIAGKVPSLAEIDPSLSAVAPIVERALAQRPSARQPDVASFLGELEAAARLSNLIGTRIEVAALVERAFGDTLRARAARITTAAPRTLDQIEAARKAPFARDDQPTASIGLPSPLREVSVAESQNSAVAAPIPPPPARKTLPLALLVGGAMTAIALFAFGRDALVKKGNLPSSEVQSSSLTPVTLPSTSAPLVDSTPRMRPSETPILAPSATSVPIKSGSGVTHFKKKHPALIPSHAPDNPYAH